LFGSADHLRPTRVSIRARAFCRFKQRTWVIVGPYEESEKTRMQFHQTGLTTEASRESHIGGWCDSMDKLVEQFAG